MKGRIPLYGFACCIVALTLLAGCNGGLGRGKAAELLSQKLDAEPVLDATITFILPGVPTPEKLPADQNGLGVLNRLGYVDCEIIPEGDIYTDGGLLLRHVPPTCKLILTAKGVKASANWKVNNDGNRIGNVTIPVAKTELIEVTGISMQENGGAVATFTWRSKPINDVGEGLGTYGKPQSGSALFHKFDDGWRLAGVHYGG